MIKQDHAVGNIFFEALPCECCHSSFTGNNGGNTPVFKPLKESSDLGTNDTFVSETREKIFDGIEKYSFCFSAVDRVVQSHEETGQIVFASLFDLGFIDMHIIDLDFLFGLKTFQVEAERGDVDTEFFTFLFEGDDNTGFIDFLNAVDDEQIGRASCRERV